LTCEEISVKIESDDETVVYDFADPAGSPSTSWPEALLGEGLLTCEEIAVTIETDDDAVVYDFADPAGSPSAAGSPSQAVTSPVSYFLRSRWFEYRFVTHQNCTTLYFLVTHRCRGRRVSREPRSPCSSSTRPRVYRQLLRRCGIAIQL
jgi:hypothetical protein